MLILLLTLISTIRGNNFCMTPKIPDPYCNTDEDPISPVRTGNPIGLCLWSYLVQLNTLIEAYQLEFLSVRKNYFMSTNYFHDSLLK